METRCLVSVEEVFDTCGLLGGTCEGSGCFCGFLCSLGRFQSSEELILVFRVELEVFEVFSGQHVGGWLVLGILQVLGH